MRYMDYGRWYTVRRRLLLQCANTLDVKVPRNSTSVLVASSCGMEGVDQRCLALVDPVGLVNQEIDSGRPSVTDHLTLCASLSMATLIVVQEKRTSDGKPNTGSIDVRIHACVFGSEGA